MKVYVVILCAIVAFQAAAAVQYTAPFNLTIGYYNQTYCTNVETVVRDTVYAALAADRRKGFGLLRLLFHDCWVGGCDGSVLIDPTYANPYPEKTSTANIGLRGLDVIDAIKTKLENTAGCRNTVSCADIIAFAARDAVKYLSNYAIDYNVPAGRKDGLVSLSSNADKFLPGSNFGITQLTSNFAAKEFSVEEMVILSGAHSVGEAHCSSFRDRLSAPDGQINPAYRTVLGADCRAGPDPMVANNIRDQDPATLGNLTSYIVPAAYGGTGILDNSYYHNNLNDMVLFRSDWALVTDGTSLGHVQEYAENATEWNLDFAAALEKLSRLQMPAESRGEIRKKCNAINT